MTLNEAHEPALAVEDVETLGAMLKVDEGIRARVYLDSLGIETIGVGRNLRDVGLSQDEIDYLLANDIERCVREIRQHRTTRAAWDASDTNRRLVLANMCFNLGISRLLKFRKTLEAWSRKDWARVSVEMLDSKWADQVGNRARRLSGMVRRGTLGVTYQVARTAQRAEHGGGLGA